MKIIVIASVPHTGTIFTLNFLKSFPNVKVIQIHYIQKTACLLDDFDQNAINLMYGHIQPQYLYMIQAFGATNPLVISLRDPLASMITLHHREPGIDMESHIKSWVDLVKIFGTSYFTFFNPIFFPVDLLSEKSPRSKIVAVFDLIKECFIRDCYPPDYEFSVRYDWCNNWDENIAKSNSRGEYDGKYLYKKRDIEAIRNMLGQTNWTYLKQQEELLRPFLESQGYRDLLWWD